ncbi:MAG: proton-conducting transporter membrane subunit, partial [Balneolaceae bacterium]
MDYLHDINSFLPGTITATAGLIVIMLAAFRKSIESIFTITVLSLVIAFLFTVRDLYGPAGTSFSDMIAFGGTAAFGTLLVIVGTLFCVLISREYLTDIGYHSGEVYGMVLFATTGMLGLASSNDLITLFIGLETMSICLYVLAGLIKEKKTSAEAALKYF